MATNEFEKGSYENPYTLEEYEAFEEGTWPGGFVQMEEGKEPVYIPTDIVNNEGDDGSGSGEGSEDEGSGSDESDEGDGSGTYVRRIDSGSTSARIVSPHLSFNLIISWTEGIVTGEGNEYGYIINKTHGSYVDSDGSSVPESYSKVEITLDSVNSPYYNYSYVPDSFNGYGYWIDYTTIHVCIDYEYAVLPQNEIRTGAVSDDVSVGAGSGSGH